MREVICNDPDHRDKALERLRSGGVNRMSSHICRLLESKKAHAVHAVSKSVNVYSVDWYAVADRLRKCRRYSTAGF